MHESEGSVITDIWRTAAANYNTALRKAAEHEPISRNRCYGSSEKEWSLTEAQKERLGEHLETEYGTFINLLGDNFQSAVVRMAVQIERIAMILSALRIQSTTIKI